MEPIHLNDRKYQLDTSSSSDDSDTSEYYPESKRSKLRSDYDTCNYTKNDRLSSELRLPTRQPKCFTKNAVMARENRLRKKKYVQNLESQTNKLKHENKSLSSILNNQSNLITELRKEVKYLKSVLANSSDISKLLKLINRNTGMSVSTSLNKSLSVTGNCLSKTEHPWTDSHIDDSLLIPDLGLLFEDNSELNEIDEIKPSDLTLREHNYTTINENYDENVGVCLHVSKHRVSLEFCSSCSDNAISTWNDIEGGV